jgi:hypothetical protein
MARVVVPGHPRHVTQPVERNPLLMAKNFLLRCFRMPNIAP